MSLQSPLDLVQLVVGVAVFVLPGLALARHILPGRLRWVAAPVLSATVLPLAAIVLDTVFNVRMTMATTFMLCMLGGAWLVVQRVRRPTGPRVAPSSWAAGLGAAAVALLMASLMHAPHVEADGLLPQAAAAVEQAVDAWTDTPTPYPLHADEHIQLARSAQMERYGTTTYLDPYTTQAQDRGQLRLLYTVNQRGFQVAVSELHLLTDVSLPFLFRFLPAVAAGFLALTTWAALRPMPGAAPAAALTSIVPTTVLFLGPSFLVPIGLGLAWIVVTAWVGARAEGRWREAGLVLLVAGGMFMHLVIGAACFVAAAAAWVFAAPDSQAARIRLALVVGVPFLIAIVFRAEILHHLALEWDLPWERGIIDWAGWLLFPFALTGAALAWLRRGPGGRMLRSLSLLYGAVLAGLAFSVLLRIRSLPAYYRGVLLFFLLSGIFAGIAIGFGSDKLRAGLRRTPALVRTLVPAAVAGLAIAVVLAPAVAHQADSPIYHPWNHSSWRDLEILVAAEPEPGLGLLADPWQAGIASGLTGLRPWTVLYPGVFPKNLADWNHYLESGGADPGWLRERGIDYVMSTTVPNATYEPLGGHVYRLVW